ncbi:uncharacterized protein LOC129751214 [Uranotaenia lowii]|uniref:uncharacterized protein LOC129751214 n=1 Tax=Uranotaenia lowii TaxID=190385 RepID=UPI00247ADAEC|nr:uncharacterized protein LOC129751214 [Uranotaenia lowii]
MRPGPGLVVMALAFISGARRGTSQQSSASQDNKLGKFEEDNTEALSRINPWLSACDLAQPNSAPDLQGQCSAGTLPVAWIDEGPGPPRCPPPCTALKSNNKHNSNYKANNIDNTKYNMENRLNDKQQCLDYLGDNDELSPAQICKKSSQSIETKLRALRLRHCCERTVGSALHNEAYVAVLKGGSNCFKKLSDLLEIDTLAARITCEFTEVLVRYDCGQAYSIIHHCEDCKEAYRRWGCSILLPYFTTRDEVANDSVKMDTGPGSPGSGGGGGARTSNNNSSSSSSMRGGSPGGTAKSGSASSSSSSNKSVNNKTGSGSTQGKSNTNYHGKAAANKQTEPNLNDANKQQLVNNISFNVKSSRRKTQRVRIRPCLDVCQTVEQKCPYMLPGDRAPALPTQYAGEPTFLCRDLNIDEVGQQQQRSNTGSDICCYDYCGSNPQAGVCSRCDPLVEQDEENNASDDRADKGNDNRLHQLAGKTTIAGKTANPGKNSSTATNQSISSSSNTSSSSSSFLDQLLFSSELPPRLPTCPSITSATTPSTQPGSCKSPQQLVQQHLDKKQLNQQSTTPSSQVMASGDGRRTTSTPKASLSTTTTTTATSVASSASSLASSSVVVRLISVSSILTMYFNNSLTMRLRCLDKLVAWAKILLQPAGL